MIKIRNLVLTTLLAAFVYGCSDDNGSGLVADENSNTPENSNTETPSTQTPVTQTPTIETPSAEENANTTPNTGSNGQVVGVWDRCIGGINAFVWVFEENNNFRTYSVPDCSLALDIDNSTQGGTYEVLGTSTSEEGLPLFDLRLVITDVFGGFPQDDASELFINMHVDGDTMYFGAGGSSREEASRILFFDAPHVRR